MYNIVSVNLVGSCLDGPDFFEASKSGNLSLLRQRKVSPCPAPYVWPQPEKDALRTDLGLSSLDVAYLPKAPRAGFSVSCGSCTRKAPHQRAFHV